MPDSSEEAQAVVSLIGRSLGYATLPLPRGGPEPRLMTAADAADMVADADSVSAPAKLELLARLSHTPLRRTLLEPIAMSLVRPEAGDEQRSAVAQELLDRVRLSRPGEDPLGRDPSDLMPVQEGPTVQDYTPQAREDLLAEPRADLGPVEPHFVNALVHELQVTSLSVLPKCEAATKIVGGSPALSLATLVASSRPLSQLSPLIDPREWPRCPLQSVFFKQMDFVVPAAPPPPPLGVPDDTGWSARLQEVVDFSFGFDPTGSSLVITNLDFVYFATPLAAGCTYDLGESVDHEILVDRGYLLVEDLAALGVRRTTTLKEVYLKSHPPPPLVCRLWSLAQALIGSSCISQPHSLQGAHHEE